MATLKKLDIDNPNVANTMQIPPALLNEILDGNEDALAGVARVHLTYLMEQMTHRCSDPSTSPSAVASIMEVFRKMSSLKSADTSAGGPGVVINITRAKDRDESITIDGTNLIEE